MGDYEEKFKTAAFGGYDKVEVEHELLKLKENAHAERLQIVKDLEEARRDLETVTAALHKKDTEIAELRETLAAKDKEILEMERTIREKYQSYVDNYDTIGSLVYEAKLRAKQINRETDEERDRLMEEARQEAARIREEAEATATQRLNDLQGEIDQRNRTGLVQYETVQEELNSVLEIFRQVQKQVMNSYRTIQTIASGRTVSLREEDDDLSELDI